MDDAFAVSRMRDTRMPQHDDFELLEILRATVQSRELKNPPKHDVTQRETHEASNVAR
jgi:hypothetical protein